MFFRNCKLTRNSRFFQRVLFNRDEKIRFGRFSKQFSDLNDQTNITPTVIRNFSSSSLNENQSNADVSKHADILIIGGGAIGSSTAYWLKEKIRDKLSVVVVEKDLTYQEASTTLSIGGIRQQFSLKENVCLSLHSALFLENIDRFLQIPNECSPNVNFIRNGYLVLANDDSVDQLNENHELQKSLGCENELLTPNQVKQRFPWLNIDGITLGCLGTKHEGWFDPYSLLMAFQKKAKFLGAEYVNGEVIEFNCGKNSAVTEKSPQHGELNTVQIRMNNGEVRKIWFSTCIIATGWETGKFTSKLLSTQKENDRYNDFKIPIERRKRYVFCISSPNGPGRDCPMVVDPNGVHFRPDGFSGNYICCRSPPNDELEPETNDLTVDDEFFNQHIWPTLAYRVPSFEKIKMKRSWAGYYDYNTLDQNPIFGKHPAYQNIHIIAGFSGHGIQQSPAVGKCVMEHFTGSSYSDCDIKAFSIDRVIANEPYKEKNVL